MRIVSLESTFRKACRKHPHLKLLESQWRFDKELISKALQNIGTIFPHYSRHDASHSKQIIVNIERLLGDKISNLSATDMWLILEAAYNHDIGMVITHKQIQDMESSEFAEFVKDTATQPDNYLYEFAKKWLAEKAILPNGSAAHTFFNDYIQLIAEWYRRKHPENSAKIVNNPFYEIGLDSPRNELLPGRLFGTLASICKAHGQSFEELMELPFAEAGMATEDCHPRYVAALLRMGDLLDIDDNRFCPVMMRMSGSKLPLTSYTHFEKHQSIKHFRLNSERIEVKAVCPTPESYVVAYEWFEWLEKEYHMQSQRWHKIVPNKKLGRLPTLSSPDVSLEKPYLILDKGQKPGFKINQDEVLKLLRSTGLYTSKYESVREILQNAVDSTLLAIWIESEDVVRLLNPISDEIKDLYEKRRIKVDFKVSSSKANTLSLSVKDSGTGISKNDLKSMLQVGGSTKNKIKSRFVRDMPEWFKPSGNFGIGLQSIYLLSDSFTITTKSIFTHEAMKISFSKLKESSVVIEMLPPESVEYGATVQVDVEMLPFPARMSIPFGTEGEQLLRALNYYDFTDESTNLSGYEEISIFRSVHEFNNASPIKIESSGVVLNGGEDARYFSEKYNVVLSNVDFFDSDSTRFLTFFRGQKFEDLHTSIAMCHCHVDFYGYQASEFISYNREKILSEAKGKATADLTGSILEYVDKNFSEIPDLKKPFAAVFYFLNEVDEVKRLKYESYMLKYLVSFEKGESKTLSDVVSYISSGVIKNLKINRSHEPLKEEYSDETFVLYRGAAQTSLSLILYYISRNGMFVQETRTKQQNSHMYSFFEEDVRPIDDRYFKDVLNGEGNIFWEIGSRLLFPVWSEFRKLEISKNIPWARVIESNSHMPAYLVMPAKFGVRGDPIEYDSSESFISWVYENLKDKTIERSEITRLYIKLVEHMKLFTEARDET